MMLPCNVPTHKVTLNLSPLSFQFFHELCAILHIACCIEVVEYIAENVLT